MILKIRMPSSFLPTNYPSSLTKPHPVLVLNAELDLGADCEKK
jgi:hypothetical protein